MAVQIITKKGEAVLNFVTTGEKANLADDVLNELLNIKNKNITTVYAQTDIEQFSSLLVAEIYDWSKRIKESGSELNFDRLPQKLRDLLLLSLRPANIPPEENNQTTAFLENVGQSAFNSYLKIRSALSFIRDAFLSLWRFIRGNAIYRHKDFWFVFEDCSYKAIGISALVSFLVGLILAFVGALQLKSFGASIYVASMVALGMTRIMAAIMIGIIMAGRTGSSYAATLGTMQVNEEIDALKTLGVKIADYLVAPRMVALVLTIPFLTLLADFFGILGGTVVGVCFLGLSPVAYFDYSINALNWTNTLVGLLHSLVYGIIIALCGCYAGLTAGRDADAVGKATTSAVVTALVWMIVATGILTVLMEILGL